MPTAIIIFQGLFELIGLSNFFIGYFVDLRWLMVIGGIIVVLDDVIEIFMGILNPLFPVILAIILAILFTPWYVGVFWASAVFKVLGIPTSIMKIFAPQKIMRKVSRMI
jgi:hypothetical protein